MTTAFASLAVLVALASPAAADGKTLVSTKPADGLLIEYTFEGNLSDTSGHSRHGTPQGKPTFADGRKGKGVALDGAGSYIDCGPAPAELGQSFTVECWVKPDSAQNPHADIFGNHDHGGLGFVVQQAGATSNRFAASYGMGADAWCMTRAVQLTAGKWQHVAMVRTPGALTFFLNGAPAATVPALAPMVASPTTLRLGLGFSGPERCFRGCIDEFRVWSKPITKFALDLSPEEKLMPIVEPLRLQWRSVPPSVGSADAPRWEFSLPVELAATFSKDQQDIQVAMDALQWPNNRKHILPVAVLPRQAGFKAVVAPVLPPGAYMVTAQPHMTLEGRSVAGEAIEFTWVSTAPPVALRAAKPPERGRGPIAPVLSQSVPLGGPGWRIAVDPDNSGRKAKWFDTPPTDSRSTRVPSVIQGVFPGYHGVAWYWREFDAPPNPHQGGRCLIRFEAVDYLAEVWVNGHRVGEHEGGETPFALDVTDAVRAGAKNLLAVRVLNPTHEPIDGIVLKQTASGVKNNRITGNMSSNAGGIVDSVALVVVPAISISDVFVLSDWQTGQASIRTTVHNARPASSESVVRIAIADARTGVVVAAGAYPQKVAAGSSVLAAELHVPHHRLWELSDPALYRATVHLTDARGVSADERSVRFGFRDFRFRNGCFRLNGKRVLLKGGGHISHFPAGYTVPLDEDMLRRDVVHMKALGFNFCRLAFGGTLARVLDVFDELGMMVHQEHFGSWQMEDSPRMFQRWDRSLGEIIMRDRNHPSVVEWGMLNETMGGTLHDHAAASIPLMRALDPSRVLVLNSGGSPAGTLSNPGEGTWDVRTRDLLDLHLYVTAPVPREHLDVLRTGEHPESIWGVYASLPPDTLRTAPLYLSEYGQSGSQDLPAIVAHYERTGQSHSDEARYYRRQRDLFMADWQGWQLSRVWPRTEDFADDANRALAEMRKIGEAAVRSNPRVVAYTPSHIISDITYNASGATDFFREFKPHVPEAYLLANAPLRWCLLTEPQSIYRRGRVRLDASLANEDMLPPGEYPAHFQVVGPDGVPVFGKTVAVRIPARSGSTEPPFAQAVLSEELTIDGPPGAYRLVATLAQGGMGKGGNVEFHVTDAEAMPAMPREVVLWGDDAPLAKWLAEHSVKVLRFDAADQGKRQVILASAKAPAPGGLAAFSELARRIARGSQVVFLDPAVFADVPNAAGGVAAEQYVATQVSGTRWLPLVHKGTVTEADWVGGYFRGARWAKKHPIFDGLPAGGMLDCRVYRNLISPLILSQDYTVFAGGVLMRPETTPLDRPAEAVCGSIRTNSEYVSGLHIGVWDFGAGRFIVNALRIRENLGADPAADRLLRNLLNYAARDLDKPVAELPADFQQQLRAIGYE